MGIIKRGADGTTKIILIAAVPFFHDAIPMIESSRGKMKKKKLDDRRPWGGYSVLEEQDTHKVKRIEVLPGKRLSYQKHRKRAEHWVIVGGKAIVVLDGKEVRLKEGQAIHIPKGSAHRIGNPGKEILIFIEIQKGDYFGEDDIIRLEDDYGRVEP
jgi:mannose-6-phosphate isomerase